VTPHIIEFVKNCHLSGKTLDVGSYDVNGSVRHLFTDYIGVDMRPGPNVDKLANAHALPFDDETFDNVLCLEMLEHDSMFWVSIAEMKRVLKPGGTLLVTTRGIHFPHHDYPSDYYRFTREALKFLFDGMEGTETCSTADHGVYARGVKPIRSRY